MKIISVVVFLFVGLFICCSPLAAQNPPETYPRSGEWELGVLAGGGAAVSGDTNAQFAFAGARIGRVITGPLSDGWTRGELEIAFDVLPVRIDDRTITHLVTRTTLEGLTDWSKLRS